MNGDIRGDRLLEQWLELEAPASPPGGLFERIHTATQRVRPRPWWLARLEGHHMQVIKGGRSSAGPRLSLVIALIALLAAAAAISVAVIGSKPSNQLVVTPTASPTAAATAGAPTSSPGGSIAVSGTPAPSGAPLPAELIGAWYSPPGFAWFIRAGDPACVALARTQLGCSIWTGTAVDRVPYTFATTTIVGGQLTLHWLNGYCSLITSRYAYALSGDSLVLTELPGGCNGGNLTLTRAGTGSAPSAPPQPSPAP